MVEVKRNEKKIHDRSLGETREKEKITMICKNN